MMLMLAIVTAKILQVADRTIYISVIAFTAMIAVSEDYILICAVNRNGDTFIEYIAFTVKKPALHFRVLAVCDDASF
ncbi:hypothetical protein D3C78_1544620 [compost metagenome]